jgi:hypothetical protein
MTSFNGLGMNLGNLSLLSNAQTRSISAENFNGEKGQGGKATEGEGAECASNLGKGWKISPCVEIKPQEEFALADIEGMGAIQSMWFGGYVGRDFILRMYWDNQEIPSVECPFSDFFACGFMDNSKDNTDQNKKIKFAQLNSIPVTVNPNNGLNCFWEMPFRKRAKITLQNISEENKVIFYQINYTLTEVLENAAYFHAQFRLTKPIKYMDDYTIIDGIKGKGHYVGTSLLVGLNGEGKWWGEGEIKIFIDGDKDYPTICGTGTEDYFGGAYNWDVRGEYVTYSTPFMGMHNVIKPDGLYVSQQQHALYRWHIMDSIRFEEDLRITLQDLGWRNGQKYLPRRDDMASVAYWYQTLPTNPFPQLPSREEMEII